MYLVLRGECTPVYCSERPFPDLIWCYFTPPLRCAEHDVTLPIITVVYIINFIVVCIAQWILVWCCIDSRLLFVVICRYKAELSPSVIA